MGFNYIGTVYSQTRYTKDGEETGEIEPFRWILWTLTIGPFEWRRARWQKGGPVPPLQDDTKERDPAPVLQIVDSKK